MINTEKTVFKIRKRFFILLNIDFLITNLPCN